MERPKSVDANILARQFFFSARLYIHTYPHTKSAKVHLRSYASPTERIHFRRWQVPCGSSSPAISILPSKYSLTTLPTGVGTASLAFPNAREIRDENSNQSLNLCGALRTRNLLRRPIERFVLLSGCISIRSRNHSDTILWALLFADTVKCACGK